MAYQNTKYYTRAKLAQYLWIKQYRLHRQTFEFGGKGTAAYTCSGKGAAAKHLNSADRKIARDIRRLYLSANEPPQKRISAKSP